MDQTSSLTEKTLPAKPLAGLFVVLFVATIIGGWLYVDSIRNELEIKIEALGGQQSSAAAGTLEVPVAPSMAAKPIFFPPTVKVGDKVGAWTVTKIESEEPGYPSRVTLNGSATVTGTYTFWPESEPFFGGQVLFNVDKESSILLPAASTLLGGNTFGFLNFVKANSIFGPEGSTGSATIVVSDYTVNLIEGEAWDMVELFEVVAQTRVTR